MKKIKIQNIVLILSLLCFLGCKKNTEVKENGPKKHINLLWRNNRFDWITPSIITDQNSLFFGSLNNHFYSVDITTGAVHFKIKTDYNPFYKGIINKEHYYLTNYASALKCYYSNGTIKWTLQGDTTINKDITAKNQYLYGTLKGIGYSKINSTDGAIVWHLPQSEINTRTNKAAFYKDKIYLGVAENASKLLAIRDHDGSIIWENSYPEYNEINQVPTDKGILVSLSKDYKVGQMQLLNYDTGKIIWKQTYNCDTYYPPCIVGDNVIISATDHTIISINSNNGKTNWILKLKNDQADTSIIAFKEQLYFGTLRRKLYNIALVTGKVTFVENFKYGLSTPVICNHKLYFPTGGCELWELK